MDLHLSLGYVDGEDIIELIFGLLKVITFKNLEFLCCSSDVAIELA